MSKRGHRCSACQKQFSNKVHLERHYDRRHSLFTQSVPFSEQNSDKEENNEELRPMIQQFPTSESFSSYVTRARKNAVRDEGWRNAVIKTACGINRTGVFRAVYDVMIQAIEDSGGPGSVMDFKEEYRNGECVFSSPWNSNALQEYQCSLRQPSDKVVLIDLFSDSAVLDTSGTQSANNMRVRFPNIRGMSCVWHEVGIVPIPNSDKVTMTTDAIRKEKNMLWHRFFFLAFKEVLQTSHTGIAYKECSLFPRLGMNVADQVQERPTCGLKGHDSYHDCTHCLIPTRLRLGLSEATPKPKKRAISKQVTSSSSTEQSTTSSRLSKEPVLSERPYSRSIYVDRSSGFESQNQTNLRERLREIQTSRSIFRRRQVSDTVRRQLLLSKHSINPEMSLVSNAELRDAKSYLSRLSALEFPPSQASFAGAGSHPFRLYSSVSFDKLHVIEHGVLRQLTDDAYIIFERCSQYSGMSKTETVSIANKRIQDLPASASLRKFPAFRKRSDEKHAGISGKVRRELAPFLWFCVMGISFHTTPDEDRFVQTLLKVDLLQRKLLGSTSHITLR